ncbi:hypothetical protein [Mycolicibacterium peregrinum]|uniref:hypothetical protein n=1 Tax=Mycolicibacterium peregrinum TaxID=43304 RepID=UPI001F40E917|nr:hypothetical protein [Mycolicibacterium peregrinum]
MQPKANGFDPQKYHKHRQDAHERLVSEAMATVLGAENVRATQHYDLVSGDHGEIDTVVCAEWPLVVEAKAIALTEPGRQGAPRRVDKKVKELIGKPLEQTNRALTYILDEGGRSFAATQGGQLVDLLPSEVSGGTAIIATFERIDAFAYSGLHVAGNDKRPTWVVSLTDLMMVADILTDPTAFHHYARTRADMHAASVSTFAEVDALGAYLPDRLRILQDAAGEQNTQFIVGYSCDALNNFYTRQEVGLAAGKPTTGVPEEVTGALVNAMTQPGWAACADAVMAADRSLWMTWKRFRKRHRRGGTFTLTDRVSLVSIPNLHPSLHQVEDSITLTIPAQP